MFQWWLCTVSTSIMTCIFLFVFIFIFSICTCTYYVCWFFSFSFCVLLFPCLSLHYCHRVVKIESLRVGDGCREITNMSNGSYFIVLIERHECDIRVRYRCCNFLHVSLIMFQPLCWLRWKQTPSVPLRPIVSKGGVAYHQSLHQLNSVSIV